MYREDVEVITDKLQKRIEQKKGNLARYTSKTKGEIAEMESELKVLNNFAESLERVQPELVETQ